MELPKDLKQRLENELAMSGAKSSHIGTHEDFLDSLRSQSESIVDHALIERLRTTNEKLQGSLPYLDLRVKDGKYVATNYFEQDPNEAKEEDAESTGPRRAKQEIQTVRTAGPLFKLLRKLKRGTTTCQWSGFSQDTTIAENINLIFEPGKMYLVLGGPGSGKSTVLKMIADILPKGKNYSQSGTVSLSGVTPTDPDVNWTSLVGYMDQIDRLHPYLTVFETCEFAWRCRMAGTHRRPWHGEGPEVDATVAKMDDEMALVNMVLEGLGLLRVKDTFVGDQEKVRGIR